MHPTRIRSRLAAAALAGCVLFLTERTNLHASTAFCAMGKGEVLVGNNEDYNIPKTRLWFVPAEPGSFGRMYVGFDDLTPQGGMNERGLWFDGFGAPSLKVSSDLPSFQGNIVDRAMAECSTVEEVVRLFSQYNRAFLSAAVLMFADATGDAVSIEANAIVRKSGSHFVQTDFRQSQPDTGAGDARFETANTMLEQAGGNISVDLFRRILASTRQKGAYPTLYSNVYELRARRMHLYYFHDFERAVTFSLDEELRKGAHVIDIPSLFPRNSAAETYAARRRPPDAGRQQATGAATLTGLGIVVVAVLIGFVRGGRRLRLGLAAVAGVVGAAVALVAVALNLAPNASPGWVNFSIGASTGRGNHIGPNLVRADGITLSSAVAIAYGVPPIRVVAPAWMSQTRYSINAVSAETSEAFRSLLQQELVGRLQLTTHREMRPFQVFVLNSTGAPKMTRVKGTNVRIWVHDSGMDLQDAAMKDFAGVLQGVLGKPVIDETGIAGNYEFEVEWTNDDRVGSLTAALRDNLGLQLTPATRDLEALVVDGARRDPALFILGHLGRVTAAAPPQLRNGLASLLSVH